MTHSPDGRNIPPSVRRSKRVRLLGTVLAMIQVEGRRHVRGRMHQLSTSGGVVHLSDALAESSRVQLMFRVGSTTLRTEAEMLAPMWSTRGFLQPFRFLALGEEERNRLQADLHRLVPPSGSKNTGGEPQS